MAVLFQILLLRDIETIAVGRSLRRRAFLKRRYGAARWRKRKARALVRLGDGRLRWVELHWYEAHGVGRRGWKIKRFLD
jgi:hypothetical protein